ncbi:MAG: lysylphosphatidylglycerol synthase transmembrane domain-containing protein [Alphaproteobacteria bacterium]
MPALPKTPRKISPFVSITLKVLLTLTAFWLAFRDVNWDSFKQMLSEQSLLFITLAAGCMMGQILLGALRWRFILAALSEHGSRVMPFTEAFRIYYISVFFSNCLPGTIGGDVVRIWITRSDRIPLGLTVNSIIIDRLLALTGVMFLLLCMLPVLSGIIDFDPWMLFFGFILLAMIGCFLIIQVDHALERFEHIKTIKLLRYFFNCMRLLINKPVMSALSLIFATLSHVFYGLCTFVLAQGMGVELSLIECIALMPLVMLVITMPISIAGWGVREAVMVQLLALVGVAGTAAVAISLQLGILNVLVSLPAAFLWLSVKDRPQMRTIMKDES